ncbi:hypothetical protein Bca4012_026481 [Brassica carinata]
MSLQQTALGYAQLPAVLTDRCIKSLCSSSVFIFIMGLPKPDCDFSNRDTTKSSSSTAVLPCVSSSRCRMQPPRPSFFVAELLREESPLASSVSVLFFFIVVITGISLAIADRSELIEGNNGDLNCFAQMVLDFCFFLQIGPKSLNLQK